MEDVYKGHLGPIRRTHSSVKDGYCGFCCEKRPRLSFNSLSQFIISLQFLIGYSPFNISHGLSLISRLYIFVAECLVCNNWTADRNSFA